MDWTARLKSRTSLAVGLAVAFVLASGAAALPSAHGDVSSPGVSGPPSAGTVSATLEACVTSGVQAERSVTFNGEMTAVAGTARMAIRIDLEERAPEELEYHVVSAPGSGLGIWRPADPKVKVYKYVKQVSNLTSPASYRALVRFRWFNAAGHVIKRSERVTVRCLQPPTPSEPTAPSIGGDGTLTPPSTATTPSA
ncbi:MAG TPA: hypothetical protein VN889_07775 [Solirubrobacteraceae bacterium]|nr:hypothetical protein [Solirubrobacteraceae bacterium]